MMKTQAEMRALRAAIEAALVSVAKDHEVSFSLGTLRFGHAGGSARLDILPASATDGEATVQTRQDKTVADYRKACHLFGLKLEWLDQTFSYAGAKLVVRGLKPAAVKNNVLVQRAGGTGMYVVPAEEVRAAFEKATA